MNLEEKIDKYIKKRYNINEAGFSGWPSGWSKDSLKKWVDSFAENHDGLKPSDEGWFDACVSAMEDEEGIDKPEAFCAAVRDQVKGDTDWRGEEE